MRPLTEDESKIVFTKLANYIVSAYEAILKHTFWRNKKGKNLVHLVSREDEPYCFRLHRDRVFYVSESSMKLAISVASPNLMSLGTCLGKFSKSGKFKLHITALDYLAQYAKFKVRCPAFCLPTYSLNQRFQVWIKPNGEMPFLYGNHVVKAHLGRITEDTPEHQGVVVFSMNDTPLVRLIISFQGFGFLIVCYRDLVWLRVQLSRHGNWIRLPLLYSIRRMYSKNIFKCSV